MGAYVDPYRQVSKDSLGIFHFQTAMKDENDTESEKKASFQITIKS